MARSPQKPGELRDGLVLYPGGKVWYYLVRWKKGEAALLASAVNGLNGMPAGGQCFSCTPDDFKALIAFMAGRD